MGEEVTDVKEVWRCTVCNVSVEKHEVGIITDICVAEKLGWWKIGPSKDILQTITGFNPDTSNEEMLPRYSENKMNMSAWELVERMLPLMSEARLVREDRKGKKFWWFGFAGGQPIASGASTASLAICRTLLMIKEGAFLKIL